MDYDDNDFQSQNLHLAGEGSTKFPPVLRPYALPKFDFDDNLHGHVRFDSLVETEVFLGIESNEDNQWIEDFSRGNSGIEFSSTAVESCSILRPNNVWSEATSSESVEMLLKSVGREDIIPVQAIPGESNACGRLGCLTKQMEPTLKHGDSSYSETGGVIDSRPISLPDENLKSNSGWKEDVEGNQPCNENFPQTQEVQMSVDGIPSMVDPKVECKKNDLPVTEGNQLNDDINKLAIQGQEDLSASGKQFDDMASLMQNVITGSGELSNQRVQQERNDVTGEDRDEDGHASSKEAHMDDYNPLLSASMFKVLEERKVIDDNASTSFLEEHSGAILMGDSLMHKGEGHNEVGISAETGEFDDKVEGTASEVSHTDAGDSASLKKVDSTSQMVFEQIIVDEEHHSPESNSEVMVREYRSTMSDVEDYKVSKDGEGHDSHVGDISTLSAVSSAAEFPVVTHTPGTLGGGDGASVVFKENLNAERHVPAFTLAESAQVCDENKRCRQDDVGTEDLSISEKKTAEITSDSISMDCEVTGSLITDKGVDASFGNGSTYNELIVKELQCNTTVGNESVDHKEDLSLPKIDDTCSTEVQTRLQEAMTNEVTHEKTKGMGLLSVVCDSKPPPCGKAEAVSDRKSIPNNELTQTQSITSPMEETQSDTDKKDQENTEATSVLGDKNSGQALATITNSDGGTNEGSFSLIPFAESQRMISALDSRGCTSPADKSACDSPKVTGIAELSHNESQEEGVKGSTSQNIQVSEAIDGNISNICSTSEDLKENGASKTSRSLSFESSLLVDYSKGEDSMRQISFPAVSASIVSPIVEGSLSASGFGQTNTGNERDISQGGPQVPDGQIRGRSKGTPVDLKDARDTSQGSPQVSDGQARGRSKATTERKTRRVSAKGTGKESAKKATHLKQSEKGDKSSNASLSPSGIFQLVQSNEKQHHGHVESSNTKPFVFLGPSSSTLPDLNSSASSSAMFQQPFTDLQQVQLRAQIFVYGALIQGTVPDEPYMLSAFGGPEGGRNMWENAWRLSMERLHVQKPHPITPDTTLQSNAGTKGSGQAIKHAIQSKVVSAPVGGPSNKGTPTAINPMMALSSPLWSIPTPSDALQSTAPIGSVVDYQQVLTQVQPYQSPPVRNFIGHNASWLSQTPFRSPWVASPQTSALDSGARFSGLPITEPVHLTPIKESTSLQNSAMKPSGAMGHSGVRTNVFLVDSSSLELKKLSATPAQNSSVAKPRRRKKISQSEDNSQSAIPTQPQVEPVSVPAAISSNLSTSAAIMTPTGFASKLALEKLSLTASSRPPSTACPKEKGQDVEPILSEESLGKVMEARKQAEDAALFASEAVNQSRELWNPLDRQRNSGLGSDVESKLASAAIAVAAAAAVAKAAAAAAKVASNAALQAKLMADEAFDLIHGNSSQSNEISVFGSLNSLGKATPGSILRGEDGVNNSSSVIFAAREAARKRVEAASAASKQAENMDAMVKAAELVAEAVSQAGKIVAMGEPPTLSQLVEAGPEGYWKLPHVSSELTMTTDDMNREQVGKDLDSLAKPSEEGPSSKKETHATASRKLPVPGKMPKDLSEDRQRLVDVIPGSAMFSEKGLRVSKGRKFSDLAKTIGIVPDSEIGTRSSRDENEKATDLKENMIKEGSYVEVFKDGSGLKSAWFTANVLSLKEGKAYVSYTELRQEEGSEQLKEWVDLEGEGHQAPKIRVSRPINTMRYAGTRKRRRAAAGDQTWSVGDRVDAWMQDRWWEGVVTEKNSKDETSLTIHFPAQGVTSVVKTWHLRPSLMWKDGEWVESTSAGGDDHPHESDSPQEKRLKLGSPAVEAKGKDTIPKIVDVAKSSKSEDSRLLVLSDKEKVFDVGKNARIENKSTLLRTNRTGLQEGSRVVFGIPKPGKKRKFMDVSKHYVADKGNKTSQANDSVKFMKYLIPQGSGPRGSKGTKVETKEKQATVPRGIKARKLPGVSGRTIPGKENLLTETVSAHMDGTGSDHAANDITNSERNIENNSGNQSPKETGSDSSNGGAPHGSISFSSLAASSDAQSSKKVSSSNVKPEQANKGKLAPASGRLAKIEENKVVDGNPAKSVSDVIEPRRSIRRIQPTSRLLEGLQSSLIISKIPSVSHDKGRRSQSRSAFRGNNNN